MSLPTIPGDTAEDERFEDTDIYGVGIRRYRRLNFPQRYSITLSFAYDLRSISANCALAWT